MSRATYTKTKRQGWLLPLACGLVFFLGFESAGMQLALRHVADEFALSATMMGVLVFAQYFALLVVQPVMGVLSDRVGKKRVVLLGCALFVAGCGVVFASRGAGMYIAGAFVVGSGYGVTESVCMAALADAYPEKAARYLNLAQAVFCAGAVVSPLILDALWADTGFGWRAGFVLAAAGCLALVPFLLATPFAAATKREGAGGEAAGAVPRRKGAHGFLRLFFLGLVAMMFLYGGMESGTGSFLDTLVSTGSGTGGQGAFVLSVFWLAMMLSRVLFGVVRANEARVVWACMLGCTLGLGLLAFGGGVWAAFAGAALVGACLGPAWPMLVSMATKASPGRTGTAVAIMSAGSGTGAAVLPIALGGVADSFTTGAAMLLLAGCALAGWLVSFAYLRQGGKEEVQK